jgi:hypothetical protein
MTAFEKWQTLNGAIQNMLLLGTLIFAAYIGFKQTEISSKQAEFSAKQTEINERLLDLQYAMSITVAYEESTKRIIVVNNGHTNIYLGGYGLDDRERTMQPEARLIAPGQSHFINTENLDTYILSRRAPNAPHVDAIVKLLLMDERKVKYVTHTTLACEIGPNNEVKINTQTAPPQKGEW